MLIGEKLRRFGADKVAFLILLVIGLLIAQYVVSSRSALELSESINLKGSGLTVSLPVGNNWKRTTSDFVFVDNEFRLAAQLQISSDSGITAIWRYSIIPLKIAPAERFAQLANAVNGKIIASGSDKYGYFTYDYATIIGEGGLIMIGTTVLPNDRILTLQVAQKGTGTELAEKVFKALLASAKYFDDNAYAKGLNFLNEFKNSHLPSLPLTELNSQNLVDFFRIKDSAGNSIGFTTDSLTYTSEPNDGFNFTLSSLFFYSPSFKTIAEQSFFRADTTLTIFDWSVKEGNQLANRQEITRLQLDKNKIVTIEKSGRIEQFPFTNIMMPESLFDLVVADFLKSNFDSLYIEILLSDGTIAPVMLSRIKSTQTSALPARSAAQADFFGVFTANIKMYYDGSGRLVSSELQGNLTYRRERTTKASIFADFPQWLSKIEQIEQYRDKRKNK
ncbi:MAG: hypothetical protein A2Y12_05115 [Planctomycetes bacterium GWF2_42_9]|nr:MAG: hypothetical protein A2Y12_05115 [Planctomycetes bacterium GWF2_42_9]HAL44698.1 hypothetical protein [Phycisphaerales bacterium]